MAEALINRIVIGADVLIEAQVYDDFLDAYENGLTSVTATIKTMAGVTVATVNLTLNGILGIYSGVMPGNTTLTDSQLYQVDFAGVRGANKWADRRYVPAQYVGG